MPTTYLDLNDDLARRGLAAPAKGQVFYYDVKKKGLALRITANNARAWVVIHWDPKAKRTLRYVLGDATSVGTKDARAAVDVRAGAVAIGKADPFGREGEKRSEITLKKVLADYLASRELKPRTVADYKHRVEEEVFKDWLSRPIEAITRDDVERRHRQVTATSPSRANGAMVVLRALFNYAINRYEVAGRPVFVHNPVRRLSAVKAWNKTKPKRTAIPLRLMPKFFEAAAAIDSVAADFLRFVAYTGVRRGEAANLKWNDVDLENGTFVIGDTKNSDPLELPITRQLGAIFEKRKTSNARAPVRSMFVFPSSGLDAPIAEPRGALETICAAIRHGSTIHDLRRSFINAADESGLPFMIVKLLVNHRLPKTSDGVTLGYGTPDGQRMREASQRIADMLDGTAAAAIVDASKDNVRSIRKKR